MNISFSWLKDLIDLELSVDETAVALTRVGLAIEGIHTVGDDHILDIDLTSNRPDCLSHLGVARELSALTGTPVKIAAPPLSDAPMPAVLGYEIARVVDKELCPRFTARLIRNVKVGPSPQWLIERLEAIGERSINNIADVTNFVMHELGQPMHAFDLDRLSEHRIVVRTARAGESIITLDETERELDQAMLAICDADKPVAIAGIMGGLHSSITENTANVLLEVAYFDRNSIRHTSRRLKLTTEASHRFERGVDIDNLLRASERATRLICEFSGGEAGDLIDVYPQTLQRPEVRSNDIAAAVRRLSGLTPSIEQCDAALFSLGVTKTGEASYVPPSWRHDIAIEEDLVEEVMRMLGYENISDELPPAFGAGEYQPAEARKKAIRQGLAAMGFDEAITYSFIETDTDDMFRTVPSMVEETLDEPFVTLKDSVIEGAVRMRPSILPGILDSVRHNLNHQRRDLRLFELGKVFAASLSEDRLPLELEVLTIAVTGREVFQDRAEAGRELDFYDLKGALQAALESAGFTGSRFAPIEVKHLRIGQSALVSHLGQPIGYLGRLDDTIAARYKFKKPVYVAEIDLDRLFANIPIQPVYRPLPRFPAITRDLTVLVGRNVAFESVRERALSINGEVCRRVDFVGLYSDVRSDDDRAALTIRLEYRSPERTLIESEVDDIHERIVAAILEIPDVSMRE